MICGICTEAPGSRKTICNSVSSYGWWAVRVSSQHLAQDLNVAPCMNLAIELYKNGQLADDWNGRPFCFRAVSYKTSKPTYVREAQLADEPLWYHANKAQAKSLTNCKPESRVRNQPSTLLLGRNKLDWLSGQVKGWREMAFKMKVIEPLSSRDDSIQPINSNLKDLNKRLMTNTAQLTDQRQSDRSCSIKQGKI